MTDTRKDMTPTEFADACAALERECPYLRRTSFRRSAAHNAAVGGKPVSKHLVGMARDYGAPTRAQLDAAGKVAVRLGFWIEVHNVKTGIHLHVQGLRKGPIAAEWAARFGNYAKGIA